MLLHQTNALQPQPPTPNHPQSHHPPIPPSTPGDNIPPSSVLFDESGNFLLYPTLLGIKVVNLVSNAVSRLLGKVENSERFLQLALYQGVPKKVRRACGVGAR